MERLRIFRSPRYFMSSKQRVFYPCSPSDPHTILNPSTSVDNYWTLYGMYLLQNYENDSEMTDRCQTDRTINQSINQSINLSVFVPTNQTHPSTHLIATSRGKCVIRVRREIRQAKDKSSPSADFLLYFAKALVQIQFMLCLSGRVGTVAR